MSVHVCVMGSRPSWGELRHRGCPHCSPSGNCFPLMSDVFRGSPLFPDDLPAKKKKKKPVLFRRQHEQIATAQRGRMNNTHTHIYKSLVWGDADEEGFDVSSRCFVRRGRHHVPQNSPPPVCEGRGLAVTGVPLMKPV